MREPAIDRSGGLTSCRVDFPILERKIHGHPLVYLDSAATSLKPRLVIDAVVRFYTEYTANVHRAVHALSEEATAAFEGARERVARFIHADSREVVFVHNATDALNRVAMHMRERGPVAMTVLEHHSNFLPWQQGDCVVLETKADGNIDLDRAERQIRKIKPRLVSISTVNNATGLAMPVAELSAMAKEVGALLMLDISQSVGHHPVDVRRLGCDFACFSGHKMLGPSGIGVLYQREGLAEPLEPVWMGGSMVQEVHRDGFTLRPSPWCHEAGTPNIEGAIGLAAACDYLDDVGVDRIHAHTRELTRVMRAALGEMESVGLVGPMDADTDSIVAFTVRGAASHGVARMLSNRFGLIVRSGFQCAQPTHEVLGIGESLRASVHLYNSMDDVNALSEALGVVTNYV